MDIPPVVTEEMKSYFRKHYDAMDKESLQLVLIGLKEQGYSQIPCVFLLVEELQLSFMEANKIILHSKAWNG